ncbi:MAG: branched-chain amino acid ABC transporter permease, partial [Nitrospinota bacterium]
FCGLVGIIIEKFVYRPMITRSRIVPLIASIGLLIAMQDSVRIIVTPLAESYPVSMGRGIQTSYLHLEGHAIFILVFTCVALFLLWVIMFRTKTGMSIRAVSQNLDISAVMGIDVNKANRIVFLIGSALAGAAGVLVGIHYNILLPFMGDVPAYKALAVIVIGGFGSVLGTILGGLFLGISEALISAYTDLPMSREATAMLLMIILILFRPQGLLGKK